MESEREKGRERDTQKEVPHVKGECVLLSGHVLLASVCVTQRERVRGLCKQMTHSEGALPHTNTR